MVTAVTAATISGVVFYVSSMPHQFLTDQYQDMSLTAKLALCAIPNMAFCLGVRAIAFHEGTGKQLCSGVNLPINISRLNLYINCRSKPTLGNPYDRIL